MRATTSSRREVGTIVLLAVLAAGCGGPSAPPPLPPAPAASFSAPPLTAPTEPSLVAEPEAPPDADALAAANLAYCVDETNRYRARAGVPPVSPSVEVEAYAAAAARADSESNTAHSYTRGAGHPAPGFAENEAVRWPIARYGSVSAVIDAVMAAFWAEGPGGGHYENLRGPYRVVGCGLFVDGDRVTIVQHFR